MNHRSNKVFFVIFSLHACFFFCPRFLSLRDELDCGDVAVRVYESTKYRGYFLVKIYVVYCTCKVAKRHLHKDNTDWCKCMHWGSI